MSEDTTLQTFHLSALEALEEIKDIWAKGILCDVTLVARDGQPRAAHKLMLVAASGFFQAALMGAGAVMGSGADGQSSTWGTQLVLPEMAIEDLDFALAAIYECRLDVGPENLERLLAIGSFLQMPRMLRACESYMRTVLSLNTCVPLLLLATRYGCEDLRQHLVSYICARFNTLAAPTPSPAPAAPPAESSSLPAAETTAHQLNSTETATSEASRARAGQQAASQAEPAGPGGAFTALNKELLLELLHNDELAVDSEEDVLAAVVDWVGADPDSRMEDLPDLASAVRVEQLPAASATMLPTAHPEVLAQACEMLARIRERASSSTPPPAIGLTSQASHSLPPAGPGRRGSGTASPSGLRRAPTPVPADPHSAFRASGVTLGAPLSSGTAEPQHSILAQPGFPTPPQPAHTVAGNTVQHRLARAFGRPRRHRPTGLLAVGGHDATWRSLKVVERYDPTSDSWLPGPSLTQALAHASAVLLDRDVYVVGGTPLWNAVLRLSPDRGVWAPHASLASPRVHAGVVSAGGSVFVMGGRSQVQAVQHVLSSVEVYLPQRGTWQHAPDMHQARSALAAGWVAGGLYAVGGQAGPGGKATLRSVERFDVGSEQWSVLGAEMGTPRKYASAGVVGGRLYVVGGVSEARTRMAGVEALDPREGRWAAVAPLHAARSSCGVAALQVGAHGRLFAVGGMDEAEGVHGSVESYVPEMNQWVQVAALGAPRSGLGLCGV